MRKLCFFGLLFFFNLYEPHALTAYMAEDREQVIPILTKTMFLPAYQGVIPARGTIEIPSLDLLVVFQNNNKACKVYLYDFTEEQFFGAFDLHGLVVAVSSKQQEILFDVKGPHRTERVACVVVRKAQLLNENEEYIATEIGRYLSRHVKQSINPQIILDKGSYRAVENMPEPARSILLKLVDKPTSLRRAMSCIF